MPKQKSNRGAAKRFKRTGGGGFKFKRAFKNHILTKKSPKTIRKLRARGMINDTDMDRVEQMLPHN